VSLKNIVGTLLLDQRNLYYVLSFLSAEHTQPSDNGPTWLHSTVAVNSLKISILAFYGNVHVQVFVR